MTTFRFSDLSHVTLRSLIILQEQGIVAAQWDRMMSETTEQERAHLQVIQSHLLNYSLSLMSEATIWARAIYPLLMLAERDHIQAWAQVPLRAEFPRFVLEGNVDGVLGNSVSGLLDTPYLIVVEAKGGLEATHPQFQLYGEMLAAAWLNWQQTHEPEQEIFGCYTISGSWTFVHGMVREFEADSPTM